MKSDSLLADGDGVARCFAGAAPLTRPGPRTKKLNQCSNKLCEIRCAVRRAPRWTADAGVLAGTRLCAGRIITPGPRPISLLANVCGLRTAPTSPN